MEKDDELLKENINECALTVDVEDYFQVSAFEGQVKRDDWQNLEHRVEVNTHKVLDLFAKHEAKSTFFILGWVAKQYPQLITRIVDEGHEVASHGFYHQRLTQLTHQQIKQDISDSKSLLEDISGKQVLGYRAPSFSINKQNLSVFDLLWELGFKYSSSTYPVKHDLYGVPDWPRQAYQTEKGLWEIPMSTLKVGKQNFPISGGGYFRLLPFWLSKMAIKRFLKTENFPYVFYFHPWEIDAEQPRFKDASIKSKIRHYSNLKVMENKVEKLLVMNKWRTMQDIYF